jgi:serine/threonine-protein kinase
MGFGQEPVGFGHPAVEPGRSVGRFVLVEPLGAGSQAVVWRAVQKRPVRRAVALKILTEGRSREARCIARLTREAERGARLVHPSLLPVEGLGRDGGVIYMILPLVDGPSLDEVIAQRRRWERTGIIGDRYDLAALPPGKYYRALALLMGQIASALQTAHDGRVAHRDIKPANILITSGRSARAYLIDFGVARDLDVATPAQLRDGAGTPMYMPPEKLRGGATDELLSDIYALGVSLFEAATCSRPFRPPDDLPITHWAPYLAATTPRRPIEIRPDIPARLAAIIERAMAREPSGRYSTPAALANDLERFARGKDSRRCAASAGRPLGLNGPRMALPA